LIPQVFARGLTETYNDTGYLLIVGYGINSVLMIRITTPSRLHLTLIDMNASIGRVDGGVGITLDEPGICITAEPEATVTVTGDDQLAERMMRAVKKVHPDAGLRIHIEDSYPPHVGLGSGTQAALAAGMATSELYDLQLDAVEIGKKVGRGGTSGIGIAAFEKGGFILDGGHRFTDKMAFSPSSASSADPAPILARHEFPDWEIVLAIPNVKGASSRQEVDIFEKICPIPLGEVQALSHIILMKMLPAVVESDFEAFSNAVNRIQEDLHPIKPKLASQPTKQSKDSFLASRCRKLNIPLLKISINHKIADTTDLKQRNPIKITDMSSSSTLHILTYPTKTPLKHFTTLLFTRRTRNRDKSTSNRLKTLSTQNRLGALNQIPIQRKPIVTRHCRRFNNWQIHPFKTQKTTRRTDTFVPINLLTRNNHITNPNAHARISTPTTKKNHHPRRNRLNNRCQQMTHINLTNTSQTKHNTETRKPPSENQTIRNHPTSKIINLTTQPLTFNRHRTQQQNRLTHQNTPLNPTTGMINLHNTQARTRLDHSHDSVKGSHHPCSPLRRS